MSYTILMRVLNADGLPVSEEEQVRFEWPEIGFTRAAPNCEETSLMVDEDKQQTMRRSCAGNPIVTRPSGPPGSTCADFWRLSRSFFLRRLPRKAICALQRGSSRSLRPSNRKPRASR